ncbi:hypothetical protein CHARACLAT_010139 [Characodon lateralis]|uniref:Uncharacterized protein n=1 Tax=Characodon lateralis TaxID=208331 RepID=A0ABU7CMY8_9TELE|nr:hypothetical protein [Characodon lateralis]
MLLLFYWTNLAGCRHLLPASHRSRRTCPPSIALKQPSSGTILPDAVAHFLFGAFVLTALCSHSGQSESLSWLRTHPAYPAMYQSTQYSCIQ